MKIHWFLSPQFRQTSDLWNDLTKLREAQADLLAPEDLQALDAVLDQTKADLDAGAEREILATRAAEMENAAQQWLRPYPHADWREIVEVLLVAIALALGIRTFFAQPFKIPTGSMQPTLFGITFEDRHEDTNFVMPGMFSRLVDLAVYGTIYHQAIAAEDGVFDYAGPLQHVLGLVNKQTVFVRYTNGPATALTIYGGPDEALTQRAGLNDTYVNPRHFRKGEPIYQFVEHTGDHLFVDRLTYNFRHPKLGEIVVFKTTGIPDIHTDQFYIKRLIGLPGTTLSIGDDRHVRVDGVRLDASTPHFQGVYGFDTNTGPRESRYSGHTLWPGSHLGSPEDRFKVREKHYAVLGDNTVNSSDSRFWGDFPEENIMGRGFLVYWPYSGRFGFLGNRWRFMFAGLPGLSYRLKDHGTASGKEDKNKKTKSKSNDSSAAEAAS